MNKEAMKMIVLAIYELKQKECGNSGYNWLAKFLMTYFEKEEISEKEVEDFINSPNPLTS